MSWRLPRKIYAQVRTARCLLGKHVCALKTLLSLTLFTSPLVLIESQFYFTSKLPRHSRVLARSTWQASISSSWTRSDKLHILSCYIHPIQLSSSRPRAMYAIPPSKQDFLSAIPILIDTLIAQPLPPWPRFHLLSYSPQARFSSVGWHPGSPGGF